MAIQLDSKGLINLMGLSMSFVGAELVKVTSMYALEDIRLGHLALELKIAQAESSLLLLSVMMGYCSWF